MKGLILNHFWSQHTHELEEACVNKTVALLNNLNDWPIYTRQITHKKILNAITNKNLHDEPCRWDQGDCIIYNLQTWIKENNIDKIYVAGFHFNYCVMELASYVRGAIEALPELSFQDNCTLHIIKECSVAFDQKLQIPKDVLEYNYGMDKNDVDPWLISINKL
jgi:hypothetical protein